MIVFKSKRILLYTLRKKCVPLLQDIKFHSNININLTTGLKTLQELFKKNNYEIRIVGGAVRDILLNKVPKDYDFATTATPAKMKMIFEEKGVKILKRNGEAHGTVAVRMESGEDFEVTTLRRDLATDGRRAKVEFITDWQQDSLRRDFTVNAIYADFDGRLHDFHSGLQDLEGRHVRFIGDPSTRIREDYSRILRYFRFCGKVGSGHFDEEVLGAIRENVSGLKYLSGQRRWMELRKILGNSLSDGGQQTVGLILHCMGDVGVLEQLGLPKETDHSEFLTVHSRLSRGQIPHLENKDPLLLLAALLRNEQEVCQLAELLKLSRAEQRLLQFILDYRSYSLTLEAARVLAEYEDNPREHHAQIAQLLRYQGHSVEELLDFVKQPRSRHTSG